VKKETVKKAIWKPHATVAAIVEQGGKFLLVEEMTSRGNRFNQPAGHLEDNETITHAVIREMLEETAYDFTPEALLGIYHWKHDHNDTTYLRFAFIGKVGSHYPEQALDTGIIRAVWMSIDEIRAQQNLMRSEQVLSCFEDYLAGKQHPLETITHYE
jgi:ADP-ribose pyrophosphatase YjhB (NUDIX family)|tara:strand:- start:1262 stop:1732 length:471 start_codon:yes stop_codon:yes gene_type:complete